MSAKRRRASTVVVSRGKLLTVRLQDPATKVVRHFPPGGLIENGESAEEAAVRETKEETGLSIALLPIEPIVASYPFLWNERTYDCTTSFFASVCDRPITFEEIQDAKYHLGVAWIPFDEVDALMGFDTCILAAVKSLVKTIVCIRPEHGSH